jgi:hypothetical protein
MGYFPCALVRPTLAFNINLLEFITIGSHQMAPNVAGWSSTLQYFLSIRGYLVSEKVCIFLSRFCVALRNHLGNDLVALWKCVALVSSSKCDGRPRSQDMDLEYDLCSDGHGDHDAGQWH